MVFFLYSFIFWLIGWRTKITNLLSSCRLVGCWNNGQEPEAVSIGKLAVLDRSGSPESLPNPPKISSKLVVGGWKESQVADRWIRSGRQASYSLLYVRTSVAHTYRTKSNQHQRSAYTTGLSRFSRKDKLKQQQNSQPRSVGCCVVDDYGRARAQKKERNITKDKISL